MFFRAWHTSLFCFLFFLSASLCSKVSPPLLTAAKHNKAASQWAQVVSKFNAALKEIGDVENWAERLEDDMHTIVDTLEYIHRGAQGSAGWGGVGKRAGRGGVVGGRDVGPAGEREMESVKDNKKNGAKDTKSIPAAVSPVGRPAPTP